MVSVKEILRGDGITTTFTLKYIPKSPITTMFVNTVRVYEGIDFTVDYTKGSFTLTTAPADGVAIVIVYNSDLEKTFTDIVADMIYYVANNQTEVTDFNEGGIVRTILEAIAYELGTGTEETNSLYAKLSDVYRSAFVDTAVGTDLENVVALVGVTRNNAVKATGEVTFSISDPILHDIVITAGTIVSTSASGSTEAIQFQTTEDGTLLAGNTNVNIPIEAISGGSSGNVGANAINTIVTPLAEIESVNNATATSGGLDEETDDELRARAKRALAATAKATESAIVANVLNISGINECILDDLALLKKDEKHTFVNWSTSEDFTLTNVPFNWIRKITGIVAAEPHTFVQGVDYEVVNYDTGACHWLATGDQPDDSTDFYVDYEYVQMGGFNAIIKGDSTLSVAKLDEINTIIDTIKAAGITYTVTEPVGRDVDVNVTIECMDGYEHSVVTSLVESALTAFLENLGIGNDVYVAKLYDIIMDVSGVKNANITIPSTDVTIYSCEYATVGTITVS